MFLYFLILEFPDFSCITLQGQQIPYKLIISRHYRQHQMLAQTRITEVFWKTEKKHWHEQVICVGDCFDEDDLSRND